MDREDEYRVVSIGLCIVCFLLTCVTGIINANMQALEEECKLNASYYEERIDSYKYEVEILSQEIELTTDTLNVENYIACLGGCQKMQIFHNLTKNETLRVPINPIDYEICRYFCWQEYLPNLPYVMKYEERKQ